MPGAKFRAVYVPRFATRSCSSSQKSGQQIDEYLIELPSEQRKQGRLDLSTKKVKMTKHTKPLITMKKVKEADLSKLNKSPILEVKRINQRLIHGGTSHSQSKLNQSNSRMSGGSPDTVNEDVFTFSQRNEAMSTSEAAPQQSRARLSVLRTISRMLQENQGIRERLVPLTQNRYCRLEGH